MREILSVWLMFLIFILNKNPIQNILISRIDCWLDLYKNKDYISPWTLSVALDYFSRTKSLQDFE